MRETKRDQWGFPATFFRFEPPSQHHVHGKHRCPQNVNDRFIHIPHRGNQHMHFSPALHETSSEREVVVIIESAAFQVLLLLPERFPRFQEQSTAQNSFLVDPQPTPMPSFLPCKFRALKFSAENRNPTQYFINTAFLLFPKSTQHSSNPD